MMTSAAKCEVRLISSLGEMRSFATEMAEVARGEKRLLLLLSGEMGSGKTQFTRFFVEALDAAAAAGTGLKGGGKSEYGVSSPSFSIHQTYLTSQGAVEHLDLFRLQGEDDLESTGFWDLFAEPSGIVVIEWADRLEVFGLKTSLPRNWPQIEIIFEVDRASGPQTEKTNPGARRLLVRKK